jgi:translation initiation factor IF-1
MTEDGTAPGAAKPARVRATVLGPAKNLMFRLQTVDGRELLAHAAGSLRMAIVRLLPGDQVLAEVSAFDPDKARICRILKTTQPSLHQHSQPSASQQQLAPPTDSPKQREVS